MSCFFADREIGAERAIQPVRSTLTDGRRHYRFAPPSEEGLKVCAPGVAPLVLASAEAYFSALGLSYDDYARHRLDTLEGPPPVMEPAPAPAPLPAPILIGPLYFPYGSSELGDQERSMIESYLLNEEGAAIRSADRIILIGHADRGEAAEAEDGAFALSLARAETVKAAFVDQGVPAEIIETLGVGSTQPAHPTPAGIREPLNRRVEIIVSVN